MVTDPSRAMADASRERLRGHPEVCVAVLDGAPDLSHPAFAGADIQIIPLDGQTTASGSAGIHGTRIASVIFGKPGGQPEGIVPRCRGLAIPVFTPRGEHGIAAATQSDLANGINLAVAHGADIINISGGQFEPSGEAEPQLAEAVARARAKGVVIVAAAGNEGCACHHVPAALEDVISVGAMARSGQPLESSNWGEAYRGHMVLAPGEEIPVAEPDGTFATATGTSYAAAIVSGVAALVLSEARRHKAPMTGEQLRNVLLTLQEYPDTAMSHVSDAGQWIGGRLKLETIFARLSMKEEITMSEDNARAAPAMATVAGVPAELVTPSDGSCGCGGSGGDCSCKSGPAQLVYVLGQVNVQAPSRAKRQAYLQQTTKNLDTPHEVLELLATDPTVATDVIWTLEQDTVPLYAIVPCGPFAQLVYDRLKDFLAAELDNRIERVSIPGTIGGSVTLANGMSVPVIAPHLRGMYMWSTQEIVKLFTAKLTKGDASAVSEELGNFMERVYDEMRNPGLSSSDRAANFAATNAFTAEEAIREAVTSGYRLADISVDPVKVPSPGTDRWDVKLTFFDPNKRLERAKTIYRFTVDVTDVQPYTVGKLRHWAEL